MPTLAIDERQLTVRLSAAEKLSALHGNFEIPLSRIRGAAVTDTKFWHRLGLRIPGTALPPFIMAGTYVKKGDRAFVCWTRKNTPLEITLEGEGYSRLVVSAGTAEEAAHWADTINAYITGC